MKMYDLLATLCYNINIGIEKKSPAERQEKSVDEEMTNEQSTRLEMLNSYLNLTCCWKNWNSRTKTRR